MMLFDLFRDFLLLNFPTFTRRSNIDYKRVAVNVVDYFRGTEKDIIVISCMKAKSQVQDMSLSAVTENLNVALTRAKECLIFAAI